MVTATSVEYSVVSPDIFTHLMTASKTCHPYRSGILRVMFFINILTLLDLCVLIAVRGKQYVKHPGKIISALVSHVERNNHCDEWTFSIFISH